MHLDYNQGRISSIRLDREIPRFRLVNTGSNDDGNNAVSNVELK